MTNTLLQIFLILNVFLIGGATVVAIQHAFAHFKPQPHETERPRRPVAHGAHLPPDVRKRMLQDSEIRFQTILDRSAAELQHDLKTTTIQLNKHLDRLANEVAHEEMKRYRAELDNLREQAAKTIHNAQTEIAEHQAILKAKLDNRQVELEKQLTEHQTELESKLNDEIAADKQRLSQQIDTKLGDAVASFLIETLQHNVDLGAQGAYLTSMLEEHKTELTEGIIGEA